MLILSKSQELFHFKNFIYPRGAIEKVGQFDFSHVFIYKLNFQKFFPLFFWILSVYLGHCGVDVKSFLHF